MRDSLWRFPRIVAIASLLFAGLQTVEHPTGARIIVDEDPSLPLVAAMVIVSSGSTVETPDIVGMSHLLEHLLFDGTTTRTRKEIYDAFDDMGVLYNAFTREDFVAYFVVSPSDSFRQSFEILCDMIFYSVIPEEELAKERQVVIEELTRDAESPESRAYDRFRLFALERTPYMYPVIGYKETVSSIPRRTIYEHYRRIYQPQNMTFLFSGNISEESARALVSELVPSGNPGLTPDTEPLAPKAAPPIFDNQLGVFSEALPSARLYLAMPAPPSTSPDVPAFTLLLDHMNDETLPFQKALRGGDSSPIVSASFSYSPHRLSAWTEAQIELARPEDYHRALDRLAEALTLLRTETGTPETIQKKARAAIVSDLYSNENLTYRAMNLANQIGIGRTADFIAFLQEAPLTVTLEEMRATARKYFSRLRFRGALFVPPGTTLNLPEVVTWTPPSTQTAEFALPQGAVLIVKRSLTAPVFAAHLLTRKRLALPAASKPGVPELTFRMLFRPRTSGSGPSLDDFGGRIKVTDDPFIPFDDYYYSRHYGFVRLEAPMDAADRALSYFLAGIFSPSLSEDVLREVKKEVSRNLLSLRSRSSYLADNALHQALFGDSLLGTAFPGDPDRLPDISLSDILQYYSQAFRPENLIISIVSNLPVETVKAKVESALLQEKSEEAPSYPPVPLPQATPRRIYVPSEGPQATIYFALPLPGYSRDRFAPWQVATLVLSDLLAEEIREKRGLAYSVGANLEWGKEYSLLRISMGTSPEKTVEAVTAISDLLGGLGASLPVDESVLRRAVNQYWGRHLRYHQSAINQAYFLAYSYYLTGTSEWDMSQIDWLRKVRPEEVQEILRDLADPARWTVVVAGRINPFPDGAAP